jgi:hypothetical protein
MFKYLELQYFSKYFYCLQNLLESRQNLGHMCQLQLSITGGSLIFSIPINIYIFLYFFSSRSRSRSRSRSPVVVVKPKRRSGWDSQPPADSLASVRLYLKRILFH